MKKFLLIILVLTSTAKLFSQNYLGLVNNNYGAFNSVLFNPAMGNKTFIAVNFVTMNMNAYNNYLGVKDFHLVQALKDNTYFTDSTKFSIKNNAIEIVNGKDKFANFSGDIRGPSVMVGIGRFQVGYLWNRVRFGMQFSGIDEKLARNIYYIGKSEIIDVNNLKFSDNKFALNMNAWSENGLSGAYSIIDNKTRMIRVGMTVKSLNGLGAMYVKNNGATFKFFKHSTDLDSSLYANFDFEVGFTNEFSYAENPPTLEQLDTFTSAHGDFSSQLLVNNILKNQKRLGKGLGVDLGVVYEKRNGKKGVYQYRVAASIVDIGAVKYNNLTSAYKIRYKGDNEVVVTDGVKGFNSRQYDTSVAKKLQVAPGRFEVFNMALPTSLNISVDYRLINYVYLNATLIQSVRSKYARGIRTLSSISVSPRFETKWGSVTMPFILSDDYRKPNLGFCISILNSVYIGSDNIGGAFGIGAIKGFDVYLGGSFSLSKQKKKKKVTLLEEEKKMEEPEEKKVEAKEKDTPTDSNKDTDKDGVIDALDACVDIPGLTSLKGCPDKDMDGTADKDDECIDVAGTVRGCPDIDLDGVSDKDDKCPTIEGTKEAKGCPDGDGDGVADLEDECPALKGPINSKGCPDADEDGFPDTTDACPSIAGKANGCPDKDLDGIADKDDKCPEIAGTAFLKGCLDSDGDSVNDADDQCPLVAGLIPNFGCPESVKDIIKVEKVDLEASDKNTLEEAFKNLEFASGQSQMKEESKLNLDKIIEILNRNPSFRLLIVGHTDNTGDAKANTQLSLERADAVKNYMVSKGLNSDRFITKGYGPDRPIADNTIDTGKQKNRRVEMTIVK